MMNESVREIVMLTLNRTLLKSKTRTDGTLYIT